MIINVDWQAGKAWQLREDVYGVTLMPSIWRTNGCRSHFTLWRNRAWYCRFDDAEDREHWLEQMDGELRAEWMRIRSEWRRRQA